MTPPPHHPYLNKLVFKYIPNHRTDRHVGEGSEESLFSAAIAAAEAKRMNNLKNLNYEGLKTIHSCAPPPLTTDDRGRRRRGAARG